MGIWRVAVLLLGVAYLFQAHNGVEARPVIRTFSRVESMIQGNTAMVWKYVKLPQLFSVFWDRQIFTYSVRSPTRTRVTYANRKTLDVVQFFRSADNCTRNCLLECGIENDETTEFEGRVTLLFRVHPKNGKTKVTAGFKISGDESPEVLLGYRAQVSEMLDNAAKFFRPAACGSLTPTMTGVCNNKRKVLSGAAVQVLQRMSNPFSINRVINPRYEDGMRTPKQKNMPNARTISNRLAELPSTRTGFKLTDMFVTFGQFLDHDIILTPGGGDGMFADNSMNINVDDANDEIFDQGMILFTRSAYDRRDFDGSGYAEVFPRQHLNLQTSYVDASHVYGASYKRMFLRTFEDGLMKVEETDTGVHLPANSHEAVGLKQEMDPDPNNPKFLAAGDARANENALLLSIHTLFIREHNRIARLLKGTTCANCNDEKLFQLARRVVMIEMQKITFNEWLPLLLGKRLKYGGYRENIDAGILHEFSTAAMRFGHSMQSENHWLIGPGQNVEDRAEINLRDSFFNPGLVKENGIEVFLKGAAYHVAQPFDHQISDSLRNFLFTRLPTALGVDLLAANIQRGRDHGLPSYNEIRVICGLKENNFLQIADGNQEMADTLRDLYGVEDNVDLFIGGILEKRVAGSELGSTFGCIVEKQFDALMHGDRFFYQKQSTIPFEILGNPDTFSIVAVRQNLTMKDVIVRNTNLDASEIPDNVFREA